MASFILKLYRKADRNQEHLPARKRRKIATEKTKLAHLVKGVQLIAFLNKAGGTGKSHVIKCLVKYAKQLCHNLDMRYTRRTIVVTALTGAAAVGIRGETSHSGIALDKQTPPTMEEIKEWKHAYMVIVDEISFGGKKIYKKSITVYVV
jgi:AAA domain